MQASIATRKRLGQVFTPENIAQTLVQWAVESDLDRVLDPACGDGRFLTFHGNSVGIEVDPSAIALARLRAPSAAIHESDFFTWAACTKERFDAAVGNPPFIRYQQFAGEVRTKALEVAARFGARLNGLSSSWAPFLLAAAGLLKQGGRMAFVVPAEIGHAPYCVPVLESLCRRFDEVTVVAIREKIFPALSQDAWILLVRGLGGSTEHLNFAVAEHWHSVAFALNRAKKVTLEAWRAFGGRLRPFLLAQDSIELYRKLILKPSVVRLAELADVGIGYVTGANDFFHVSPSIAKLWGLPVCALRPAVRKERQLPDDVVDSKAVKRWIARDLPVLLLDLNGKAATSEVRDYLSTKDGKLARQTYKCRNRDPWYVVPDVRVPDGFMSYMCSVSPRLVRNEAGCVCTNSVHAVFMKAGNEIRELQRAWTHPLVSLSCELEGHPLGGGVLKIEPGEAANIRVPLRRTRLGEEDRKMLEEATSRMRRWRHYG